MKKVVAGVVCGMSMVICQSALGASLVHRYSFNDGTAKDSVGKAHGKIGDGVKISGGQARFSGDKGDRIAQKKGERIELLANGPDGININTLKSVTLEAWYTADKRQKWQRIFDFGYSGLQPEEGPFRGTYYGDNSIGYSPNSPFDDSRAMISASENLEAKVAPEVPLNTEIHVAVTVDSSKISLYINGARVAETPLGKVSMAEVSNDHALLGASLWLWGQAAPVLVGSINEFRIYDGALTDSEVAASFKAGANKPVL